MAKKSRSTRKQDQSKDQNANITRVKASSTSKKTKQPKEKTSATESSKTSGPTTVTNRGKRTKRPADEALGDSLSQKGKRKKTKGSGFFGYFVGAWRELRQVRWPDRKATWSLTGAVLAFTGFFVAFILILDTFFNYVFETILR